MADGKREQEQCVAICLSTWREAKGQPEPKKAAALTVQPKKDEDFNSFLSRCVPTR
jgi:hypothetical protein